MSIRLSYILILSCLLMLNAHIKAQSVGINTSLPHPSAALEVHGTDKGLLVPRMNSTERSSIMSPANGLLVYDVTTESFWYFNNSEWVDLSKGVFKNTGGIIHHTGNSGSADFVFGGESLPPNSATSDTLMLFDKGKGAFRAGRILASNSWASDSIGRFSLAAGQNARASGDFSISLGESNSATRVNAFAIGKGSIAGGNTSFAGGSFAKSSGFASVSFGAQTEATGYGAIALGYQSDATGNYALAAGQLTLASGSASVALGSQTTATRTASTALGLQTMATGNFALSAGRGTLAKAYNSTAIGSYNTGLGTETSWVPTDPILEVGIGTSDGTRHNALTILKNGDFIVGGHLLPPAAISTDTLMFLDRSKGAFRSGVARNSQSWAPDSIGVLSFASGYNALASGYNSISMGNDTRATGTVATAIGTSTSAHGSNSTAIGLLTTALGNYSTAMGGGTIAHGELSTSLGFYTIARALSSLAIGRYNKGSGNTTGWIPTDPIFEVGIGSSNELRKNALTVLKNGNTGIGIATPDAPLQIFSNASSTVPQLKLTESVADDGARIIFDNSIETANRWTLYGRADDTDASSAFNIFYNNAGNILTATGLGNVGIKGTPDADFHIRHVNNAGAGGLKLENSSNGDWLRWYVSSSSANLRLYSKSQAGSTIGEFDDVTGVYTSLSDRRVKQALQVLHFNWANFMQLVPLSYQFIADKERNRNIGMIAQDVKEIYPELVTYNEEEDLYHMDYSGFGVIAIKAIQELKTEADMKDQKILELESRLLRLEKLMVQDK